MSQCEEITRRDARIRELETQIAVLKKVTKMTDSQLKAFFGGVVKIAENLK